MSNTRYTRRSTRFTQEQLDDYDNDRQRTYPQTYLEDFPSQEVEDDWKNYGPDTAEANRAMNAYTQKFKSVTGPKATTNMYNREFRKGLDFNQHSQLLSPAAEASSATLRNATHRDEYMLKYPWGYRDAYKREEHDDYIDDAFDDANEYRQIYEDHFDATSGSSCPPLTSRNRLYVDKGNGLYDKYPDNNEHDHDHDRDYDDEEAGGYNSPRERRHYSSSPDIGPSTRSGSQPRPSSTSRYRSASTHPRSSSSSQPERRGYGYADYDENDDYGAHADRGRY